MSYIPHSPRDRERNTGTPIGLYRRYEVKKARPTEDGTDDPKAEYFVLRLDALGDDPKHIKACHRAALEYARAIRPHLPDIADDLMRVVAKYAAELELRTIIKEAYWK